jgi:signal transduction histidine kinase
VFQRSLHLRLLAGAAVAIMAALVVAWLVMSTLFERQIERREAAELTRHGLAIVSSLRLTPEGAPALDEQPADPRFQQPASGLFWQVSTPTATLRSRSLWDQALGRPNVVQRTAWRTRSAPGPFGGQVFLLERQIVLSGGGQAFVQIALDEHQMAALRREFGVDLALFLVGLWLFLSAAAFAQVWLGLQPLAGLREDLQRLRRNSAARLTGERPREIEPLVQEINALAEARQGDVERARRRAGDLAHSLKTPLAAMSAQSRRARADGAIDAADGLDRAINAVSAALEAELARARASAARDGVRSESAAPREIAERLIAIVERTDAGQSLLFDLEIPASLRVPAADDIAMEIFGALIENAAKFATRRVLVSGAQGEGGGVFVTIEDDGNGIDEGRAEAALMRGGRLDEAGPGHGLGLAIVRDLVEATEGRIALGRSALGGLRVELTWPAPSPA